MHTRCHRSFQIALGLLLLVACAKHIATFALGPVVLELDALAYWEQSECVLRGDWLFARDAVDFRTPLYPVFLGVMRYLFASDALRVVVGLQHLMVLANGLLTAGICWLLTRHRGATLLGYALSVFCVTRPWFANVTLTETLFTFLLTATFAALVLYHRTPSLRWAAAFGCLIGLTILVRPVPQCLWIPLVGLFAIHARRSIAVSAVAQHVSIAVLVLSTVLLPWCCRNCVLFGTVFVARVPSVNKWQVCFQNGSAANLPLPESPCGQRLRQHLGSDWRGTREERYCYAAINRLEQSGLSPSELDQLVSQSCAEAILEHPRAFAWSTFKRFINFWRCWVRHYPFYSEMAVSRAPVAGQRTWIWEPVATWYVRVLQHSPAQCLHWNEAVAICAALGVCGLIVDCRTWPAGLSLGIMFIYFAGVTALVELENYRYRMVLEPCMMIAIATGWRGLKSCFEGVGLKAHSRRRPTRRS